MTDFPDGITRIHVETTDSTNRLACENLQSGLLVTAGRQTAGRGRYGNSWESPSGNLYLSLVWHVPDLAAAGRYAFLGAVALSDALKKAAGEAADLQPVLKWPNDVFLDGKKLAGILLESDQAEEGVYLIIGVGVNLVSAPDYACDLKTATGKTVTPEQAARCFAEEFLKLDAQMKTEGFETVRRRWLAEAHGIGTPLTARLPDGSYSGVFTGLDENGALLLEETGGFIRKVTSGEVFFA